MQQLLRGTDNNQPILALAKAYGLDAEKAAAVTEAVSEALAHRMERATLSRSGLADLLEIIGAQGREAYLKSDAPLDSPDVRADGIGILSQLVGSKDQSRGLAARVARETGLDGSTIEAMLPSIAAVVMGAVSQRTQRAFGDILKIPGLDEIAKEARDDIGGGGPLAPKQYGNPLPLPGEPPRRANPDADWTGSAGRPAPEQRPAPRAPAPNAPAPSNRSGRSPLPIPGDDVPGMGRHEDNPYGDLSDILRRGGFRIPGGSGSGRTPAPSGGGGSGGSGLPDLGSGGGGLLETIVRNVLGNVLGYQPKGVIGWIIRLILVRWGWSFVRSLLRRFLGVAI